MKITILHGKIHYKWQFSIAMLVYQRVVGFDCPHDTLVDDDDDDGDGDDDDDDHDDDDMI
jgi:hypothetical protein